MNVLRSCSRTIIQAHKLNRIDIIGKRNISRWVAPVLKEISRRKKRLEKKELGVQPDPPRNSFLEWNYDAEIYAFNHRLKENFDDNLLLCALTHRSYVVKEELRQRKVGIEDPQLDMQDNRELIENGRTLTSKIIESYLSLSLPRAPKECILALRDHLLSTDVLANSSSLIGTKDIILTEEYPPSPETMAQTFLALVAALAESVDDVHAGKFVRDFLIATLCEKDLTELWCPDNPLEILNGILEKEGREHAEPRLIAQCGVNSLLPVYQVALYSNKEYLAAGTENNVEDAVKIAALNGIYGMFDLLPSSQPIRANKTVDPSTDSITNLPIEKWCKQNINNIM